MKKFPKILLTALFLLTLGFASGQFFGDKTIIAEDLSMDEQEATIRAIKKVMPAVVSIVVYSGEYETVFEGVGGEIKEKQQKKKSGSGTGFLINSDGLILTNKHVVNAEEAGKAEYRITLNSGKKYYAQLIGTDPLNDLAILKIFDKDLPFAEIGDSRNLEIGTTVVAIGNALGIYQNSVTKGIISGLKRDIVASGPGSPAEKLDDIIQTDAEINLGNSGGPLINLEGKVVGINVAIDSSGSSIGFSIPINDARPVIDSVLKNGRIVRPKLGIYYYQLDEELAFENNLPRSQGAWIKTDEEGVSAVVPGSPADKAGLADGDIIFEINAVKITEDNPLLKFIQENYKPGDKIGLKIQRGNKIIIRVLELGEF